MRLFETLMLSLGWLGLVIILSLDELPEPCNCDIPLEYCNQELKNINQYIARYLTVEGN
jgi:hypothetical protein